MFILSTKIIIIYSYTLLCKNFKKRSEKAIAIESKQQQELINKKLNSCKKNDDEAAESVNDSFLKKQVQECENAIRNNKIIYDDEMKAMKKEWDYKESKYTMKIKNLEDLVAEKNTIINGLELYLKRTLFSQGTTFLL